jgi:hypothetical protein
LISIKIDQPHTFSFRAQITNLLKTKAISEFHSAEVINCPSLRMQVGAKIRINDMSCMMSNCDRKIDGKTWGIPK